MQFDVHANPVPQLRRAFPYVTVLQSHVAEVNTVVVAPLAEQAILAPVTGRFAPRVVLDTKKMVLFTNYLTNLPKSSLKRAVGSLEADRGKITAALDYLFFGF